MKLPRSFYQQDGVAAAKALLGKTLVHVTPEGVTKGVIVETEAYMGPADAAAHSYKGRTARTEIQYGPGGFSYVYLIYGMYSCMNIVVNGPEHPEVVLLRALEPVEGLSLMAARRKQKKRTALCSGPGKLCRAMAIDQSCYGFPSTPVPASTLTTPATPETIRGVSPSAARLIFPYFRRSQKYDPLCGNCILPEVMLQ